MTPEYDGEVDQVTMFDEIRALPVDSHLLFIAENEKVGERAMIAIRNLSKRVPGKKFRSFYAHPKLFVIRYE